MTPPSPSEFPTSRCVAAPEPRACWSPTTFFLGPPNPSPSNPGSSAVHCCSARLESLAACPAPRGKLPVHSVPTPWSAASPCSQGLWSCQAGRANSARSAGVPLLPLCARASRAGAEGEGGGRCLSVSPAFARATRSAATEAGSPSRARAGSRWAPRFQSHTGSGPAVGKEGTVRPAVPSSRPAASASLRPCHPDARSGARPGAERDGEHE